MPKLNLDEKSKTFISLILILFVSLIFILDTRILTNPPLRSDDWKMLVEPVVFDEISLVNFSDRRPFLLSLFAILSPIIHLNISLYYVANWLLILFSGLTVYQILRIAFPKYRWIALPAALIFLIYPVNYARTWLVVSINTFALLLGLLAILLMIIYCRGGKPWHLGLANLLILLSLGTYEAALGIIFLSGFLLILNREISKKQRFWMLTIFATIAFFLLWRLVIQPSVFAVSDFYLENATVSILPILKRYGQGLFIFLFNWVGPLLNPLGEIKYWVFGSGSAILLVILALLIRQRINRMADSAEESRSERLSKAKGLLKISGIGFIFWAAGYVPVISLWQPYFYGDGSRVNFAAILGASLALVALFGAMFTILSKQEKKIQNGVMIIVILMVAAGMAYQVQGQNIRQQVWQVNQVFWQKMFELVPGIKTGTKLVIVIPNYEKVGPFEMLPFRGDWEAESAFRVLYNNQELFAEYFYIDWLAAPDNWQPIGGDLERYLFVYYDTSLGDIRIIQDPFQALELSDPIENYDPSLRITAFEEEMGKYRYLVE